MKLTNGPGNLKATTKSNHGQSKVKGKTGQSETLKKIKRSFSGDALPTPPFEGGKKTKNTVERVGRKVVKTPNKKCGGGENKKYRLLGGKGRTKCERLKGVFVESRTQHRRGGGGGVGEKLP